MKSDSQKGVAIVTGGGIRVGAAISRALGDLGFHVVVNFHESEGPAGATVAAIEAAGGTAVAHRADITDSSECDALIDAANAHGPVRLLVNNAAMFEPQAFLDDDDAIWHRHLALNLEAPYRLSQRVGRLMWAAGEGRIVNISATVGIERKGDYVAYCVAKRGLDELTRAAAVALAPRVQVNGIAPGAIVFPDGTGEAERKRVLSRIPMGTVGAATDVAAAVCFFAEAPAYVTGTVLPVDGGVSASDC